MVSCVLGSRPDLTRVVLERGENIARGERAAGSGPASVAAERKRLFGKSSHAGVGRAHPDAILGVLEEGQHPVGRQAARISRIVAVTDKSLAIAIELKAAMLSPYPHCSVPFFTTRSRPFPFC